jgi:predicted fused transcriptional regulator/phosphomethylpyrimidine kinase
MAKHKSVRSVNAMTDELRDRGYAVIVWQPEDVKAVRGGWSMERCVVELARIVDDIQDRSVERGWDVLETLLPPEEDR